tara:strand:- start:14621 stop:15586 length:966 start_codon:yes stop_codon:yes gene_type:complete
MYKSEVKGKGCIVARVVADSISEQGKRITTFEIEYPRFVHSEFMTHRMFSRNAASSRAIPVSKMIEQVRSNPAMPIHWGAEQKGMQAGEEVANTERATTRWKVSAEDAAYLADSLNRYGLHKQIVNRILEPFQIMKTVVTATEWNNFFALRDHKDAQSEIRELARVMLLAMNESECDLLPHNEWHVPYVGSSQDVETGEFYAYCIYDKNGHVVLLDEEQALKVSASCCAQVSYRVLDQGLEKALAIYDQLVNGKPVHASPFEHQAKPIDLSDNHDFPSNGWCHDNLEDGVTHQDKQGNLWSGNLQGWIQNRQLIKDNVVHG